MAEELPSGVFLLTYKITTMVEQIFIVVCQRYYISRGTRHAMTTDNPVVGSWQSIQMVDEFFERRLKDFDSKGLICVHVKQPNSQGCIERYIIKNAQGEIELSYSVILEYLL